MKHYAEIAEDGEVWEVFDVASYTELPPLEREGRRSYVAVSELCFHAFRESKKWLAPAVWAAFLSRALTAKERVLAVERQLPSIVLECFAVRSRNAGDCVTDFLLVIRPASRRSHCSEVP